MRGRRIWLKGADGHRVYESKKLVVDGNEAHACYDMQTGDIEVASSAPDVMKRSLFHEHCHKALAHISAEERERIFANENREEAEEELCLYLEKTVYDLLTRNGFLRYPNPPSARKKIGNK